MCISSIYLLVSFRRMDGGRKSVTEQLKSKLRKKLKQIKQALNRVGEEEGEEAEKDEKIEEAKDEESETGEAENEETEGEAEGESETEEAEDEDSETEESEDEESETEEAEDEESEEEADDESEAEGAKDEESERDESMGWQWGLLWGEGREEEYSVGHVRDLAPGYTELAAVATVSYKRFKEEEAKCSYRAWRKVAGVGWRKEMMRNNNEMRSCLDRTIAHYRVALAKAQAAGARVAGRSVARNLLLSLSQLVARVRPHLRVAIYTEAAAIFATALELGGEDKAWLWPETRRGVVTVFRDMVEDLSSELSGLPGTPTQLVRAGEAVCRNLDRWSKVEESRATLGLLNLRVGEVVFNRWVGGKLGSLPYTN